MLNGNTQPYRLSDKPTIINFCGGRSSAFLLNHILAAHDYTLPSTAKVVFANTGKEREETLEFVRECGIRWNVTIHWIEYQRREGAKGGSKDPKHTWRPVNFRSASRNGEPFAAARATRSSRS